MKINWGTGVVIAFTLFMAFILYFVYLVQSDKKYDNELVISNYYQYETNLEGQQKKQRNANALTTKLEVIESNNEVVVRFPNNFDFTKIEGKISLYRPSDEKLDFEFPISLSSSNLLIPRNVLAGGRWDITIEWKYEGTEYYNRKSVNL